ncbi:MAG: gamma-glutamyl-gamma-aminobutyrate hydrolase family protein, partial [Candidatus Thioglobus sp.]
MSQGGVMTDSKPVIGISMFNGCIEGRPHYAIANNYISAVRRVGAVPWLIAPSEPNVELIMHKLDGLLLTGG